jgi:hypothetical protein
MFNDPGQFDLSRSVNFPAVDAPNPPASVPEVPSMVAVLEARGF